MTTDDPFLQKVTGLAGNIIMGGALSSLGYSAIQNGAIMSFIGGTAQGGFEEGTYAYNGFNELIKQTDNKKQVTVMTYDKLGRMTSRTDQDKTTWVFDKTWKGAVHTEANPNSRVRYHYDKYGRVERTSQTIGGETVEKGFSYDNLGRLKATHYPHMSMVNGYDGGSRLKQISVAKNQLWSI